MSIADELREYRERWICLTGCPPSAVPLTTNECKVLWKEIAGIKGCFVVNESAVPEVFGMDIYITPDAAERRAQILEKK